MTKIWKNALKNPALQVLLKFNKNAVLFVGSFFYRFVINNQTIPESSITQISEILLRLFTLLELDDAGYSSKKYKSFLFKQQIDLINPSIDLLTINSNFSKHINNTGLWDKEDIREKLIASSKNSLVYLNDYLVSKDIDNQNDESKNDKDYYESEIEHIMPQSGKNLTAIKKDADMDNDEEFNWYVERLGNKIPLEEKINIDVSNEWFRSKLSGEDEKHKTYSNSKFALAKMLSDKFKDEENPKWNKTKIEEATEKAVNRIIQFVFE